MLLRSVEQLSYGISAGGVRARDLRTTWAVRRSIEVTDIFTTACRCDASALERYAGEQAISAFSDGNTGVPFGKPALSRVAALAWATSTVRASKAGFEPAFPGCEVSDIFTTSVG
jgi:hypothetical protein